MQLMNHLSNRLYLVLVIFIISVSGQDKPKKVSGKDQSNKQSTIPDPCPSKCTCVSDIRVIDTLENPQMVTCSYKNLATFPDFSAILDNMTTLDLSYNKFAKINLVDNLTDLRTFNLSNNIIESIEPQAFEQLPNLQIIDLSLNKLSSLPDMVFAKLSQLKEIDLSDNGLTSLQENIFDDQQWLEVLHLRANNLKSLPEVLFRNNERLRVLDLSHNELYSLPDTIFQSTLALTTLDLSENQFSVVPSEDLARAKNLEELDISANMMKKLDHDSFTNLNHLKVLRINNMKQLTEIDDYTFSYLCYLKKIEIKFNPRLSMLAHSAFYGLNFNSSCFNLEEVNLYGNQLSEMKEHVLPVCKIPIVDLRDNQWKCDCHFKWVKSCKQDDPIHRQIRCLSPLKIANIEISDIDEAEFTCPIEGNGFSREIRLFRLFVVLFGVLTLVFMGFMVVYYLHKAKVIGSFGHKYQRMGSIHYVKTQTNEGQE